MASERDTYAGESVGKKLARLVFWRHARTWLGERFYREKHLILASREGGDVSVLRGLGVDDSLIVAVEREPAAAAQFKQKFPSVAVYVEDAGEVARRFRASIGVALLDFCSWPTDATLDTIFRVAAHGMRNRSVLGYAFMRGRENAEAMGAIRKLAVAEKSARVDLRHLLHAGSDPSICYFPSGDGRSQYIYRNLQSRLQPLRCGLFTLNRVNYHSSCAWRRGVPMSIWAKWVHRESTPLSPSSFERRLRAITKDWMGAIESGTSAMIQANGALDFKVHYQGNAAQTPFECSFDREYLSMAFLVDAANKLEENFPGKAHLLLNVAPRRLAAWRAHRTMGTYDKTA